MTAVEFLLLAGAAGLIGGIVKRRSFAGKILLVISIATLLALLAIYGPEFAQDLL